MCYLRAAESLRSSVVPLLLVKARFLGFARCGFIAGTVLSLLGLEPVLRLLQLI